jgi:hypothetical protein
VIGGVTVIFPVGDARLVVAVDGDFVEKEGNIEIKGRKTAQVMFSGQKTG